MVWVYRYVLYYKYISGFYGDLSYYFYIGGKLSNNAKRHHKDNQLPV